MSGWNAYIDTLMGGSAAIQKSAIIGYSDGSVWARTEGNKQFNATEAEVQKLVELFHDTSKAPAVGVDLEGLHYIVPRAEEQLIFGKKDKSGFFAAKTKTSILVAIYEGEGPAGSDARGAVEKLANYLDESGY